MQDRAFAERSKYFGRCSQDHIRRGHYAVLWHQSSAVSALYVGVKYRRSVTMTRLGSATKACLDADNASCKYSEHGPRRQISTHPRFGQPSEYFHKSHDRSVKRRKRSKKEHGKAENRGRGQDYWLIFLERPALRFSRAARRAPS